MARRVTEMTTSCMQRNVTRIPVLVLASFVKYNFNNGLTDSLLLKSFARDTVDSLLMNNAYVPCCSIHEVNMCLSSSIMTETQSTIHHTILATISES